ncbi:hypothetical protein BH10ACI3_BH10ACI3_24570 [soil metagenome]
MKGDKTMNRIKNFLAIAAFSLLILGIPALASAQSRDRDRDRDNDRYNNGGYNNGTYGNGGYNNGGYNNGTYNNGSYNNGQYGDMRSVVRDLKNRARDLQRQIDRELDHSRYNGSNREDQINRQADQFKDAVNQLDNNGRQNSNDIRRVVDLGSQLDRQISRSGLSYNVKNQMQAIRNDLQQLGYGSGYNNNNNRNNRNRQNGSWGNGNSGWGNGNNRPSWWPF